MILTLMLCNVVTFLITHNNCRLIKELDMLRIFAVGLGLMIACQTAVAETKPTELGAHEHGHGNANIAIEGNNVLIEIEAPADDIVGFEHAAKSDADKAKVKAAKATLAKSSNAVVLTLAAGCKQTSADIEQHGANAAGGHSEFHVGYAFKCQNIAALKAITFTYFKSFGGAKELDVAVVAPKGQKKFEVEPEQPKIDLSGLI